MTTQKFAITIENDQAKIYTPYNSEFVKIIKKMGGKWDRADQAWVVPADLIDNVRDTMRQVYGRDDRPAKLVNVKVTCKETLIGYTSGIELFGRSICRAYGRDSGATLSDGVSFIAGDYSSGGSMKNWKTYINSGSVFIVRDIPESALDIIDDDYKDSITVEIIKTAAVDASALKAEKEALLKRLAEIDEALKGAE